MPNRDLLKGLVRLHVLHHAAAGRIYGMELIEELRRHGYEVSAGTMYPLLHGLERKGLLRSRLERAGGHERRVYRITPQGRRALEEGTTKVRELFGGLLRRRPAATNAAPKAAASGKHARGRGG